MKEPKDVLELGRYLARELKTDEGVDTLGRWMAHYLAEQLDAVKKSSGAKKQQAQQRVSKLILEIWAQRSSLHGRANPLLDYARASHALASIRSGTDIGAPWRAMHPPSEAMLTIQIFEQASRLALLGIFELLPEDEPELPESVAKLLSSEERDLYNGIREAYDTLALELAMHKGPRSSAESAKTKFNEAMIELLQSIHTKLEILQRRKVAPIVSAPPDRN